MAEPFGNYSPVLISRYQELRKIIRSPRWKGGATSANINGPHEMYVYVAGQGKKWLAKREVEFLTGQFLKDLFGDLAAHYGVHYNDNSPLLACKTPDGDRLMGVHGPTVDGSNLACSIRLKRQINIDWADYGLSSKQSDRIRQTFVDGNTALLSGGTNAGKTTVLNLAAKDLPADDRFVSMEDTREIVVDHIRDKVHLLYSRFDSKIRVTAADLIDVLVRFEPNHSWMSELSIRNAMAAMQVMDTGHSFSATTHANSPLDALRGWRRRIAMSGGADAELSSVMDMFAENVALIVQVKQLKADAKGIADKRVITDVVSAKELLDKRSIREELKSEPVFPELPTPEQMRDMLKATNGGEPLSEIQEECLKFNAMMFSMMKLERRNDNRIGALGEKQPELDPIETFIAGSDPIDADPEEEMPVFREARS